MKNLNNIIKKLIFISVFSLFNIFFSYFLMPKSLKWHNKLNISFLQPASWVFSIVWFYIYLSWFVVIYYIYKNIKSINRELISNYIKNFIKLIITELIWIILFYFNKLEFCIITILIANIFTIKSFLDGCKIKKTIGYVLLPQVLWLIIAAILNIHTYILN